MPPHIPTSRPRLWPFSSAVFVGAFLLLLLVALAAAFGGVPVATVLRDPTAIAGLPFYAGALSSVGVLLWGAAATAGFLAAAVLPGRLLGRGLRAFLFWGGAFSAVLLLDDLFRLHEAVLPRYLGLPDVVVYAAYGVAVAVLATRFRHVLAASDYSLLLASVALLAGSVGFDLLHDLFGIGELTVGGLDLRLLAEDGLKLLGIAGWFTYLAWTAFTSLAPHPLASPDASAAIVPPERQRQE